MRIGLIARIDNTGLAVQTQDFARHMNPAAVLAVDTRHWGRTLNPDAIPGCTLWRTPAPNTEPVSDRVVDQFLDQVDVVWTAETPYNYYLFSEAERRGIPTVLHFNYEFLDHMAHRDLPRPTVFAAPTRWHIGDVRSRLGTARIEHIPVPIDTKRFPFALRKDASKILHTVGTGTGEDRNGTKLLIEALKRVETPIELIIRSQVPLGGMPKGVTVKVGTVSDPADLYADEGVYVMPRRFGGLCLPMHEALACGMPVVGHDREPERDLLPVDWLVKARRTSTLQTRALIGMWESDPTDLALRLDSMYRNPDIVEQWSVKAGCIAEGLSWERRKPEYESFLASLL